MPKPVSSYPLMRPLVALLALGLLAACAEPTPYGPVSAFPSGREGYSTTPLERGRFRVSFQGNSATSRETVERYLLFRAAEVTVASGGDWFRLADRDIETLLRERTTTSGFDRVGLGVYSVSRGVGLTTTTTTASRRYEASANVLVFRGSKPRSDPQAYDARSVLSTLGPSVRRIGTAE
ncbi:MAG: hypothetical protein AAGJ91_01435 [Pseudomonadota bacterium]